MSSCKSCHCCTIICDFTQRAHGQSCWYICEHSSVQDWKEIPHCVEMFVSTVYTHIRSYTVDKWGPWTSGNVSVSTSHCPSAVLLLKESIAQSFSGAHCRRHHLVDQHHYTISPAAKRNHPDPLHFCLVQQLLYSRQENPAQSSESCREDHWHSTTSPSRYL